MMQLIGILAWVTMAYAVVEFCVHLWQRRPAMEFPPFKWFLNVAFPVMDREPQEPVRLRERIEGRCIMVMHDGTFPAAQPPPPSNRMEELYGWDWDIGSLAERMFTLNERDREIERKLIGV